LRRRRNTGGYSKAAGNHREHRSTEVMGNRDSELIESIAPNVLKVLVGIRFFEGLDDRMCNVAEESRLRSEYWRSKADQQVPSGLRPGHPIP